MILVAVCMAMSMSAGAWAQDVGGGDQAGGARDRGEQGRGQGSNGPRETQRMRTTLPEPVPARAASPRDRGADRRDALADSVRRIERSTRGQVLSAERMQSDGREVNRIKVMDERGRVRVYMDDPQEPARARSRSDDN